MKRIIFGLCLLACLLGAKVVGPTESLPGRPVQFTMEGVPAEHLGKLNWGIFPHPKDAMILDLQDRSGKPVLIFWTSTEGKFCLFADVNVPDANELILHEFTIGEEQPGPDPPPPPPPPVVEDPLIIVIEETKQRTPEHFRVLSATPWREWVESRKGSVRIVDKDLKDETGNVPADLAPWIKAAKSLPYVFFADSSGSIAWEGPLPATPEALLAILKEHGGDK